MQCNVGQKEKLIRIVAGIALRGAGVVFGSWWGVIGLVPLVTGFVRWCLACQIAGINTADESKS